MKTCSVCGNDYENVLEINYQGQSHVYDCFECAIHDLAPMCASCGLRIIGHGMEANHNMYCSEHCARADGLIPLSTNPV